MNVVAIIPNKIYLLRWFLLTIFLILSALVIILGQKVESIKVLGERQWLDQKVLKNSILNSLSNHWFTASINEIKSTAEKVDWVDEVDVKRIWPNSLEVMIKEQQPIACWNNQALTNRLVLVAVKECQKGWRTVKANKGFVESYYNLMPILTDMEKALGKKLSYLEINNRGTWKMLIDNNLTIMARNKDIEDRLKIWILLVNNDSLQNIEKFKKIDLRYPNGFSVEI